MRTNYKRVYRALHKVKKDNTTDNRILAFKVCREENWSSTPFVHRRLLRLLKSKSH